ncbi:MAG TPA: EAL domain-containing protein [Mycobacteriales bacterium]|nr:EAL domain-containing protein [Mycobacteriales bacterium]
MGARPVRWSRVFSRADPTAVDRGRSAEAFGLARLEVMFCLLRAAGATLAVFGLLSPRPADTAGAPVSITAPIAVNLLALAFALGVALTARAIRSPGGLHRLGVVAISFDLLFFAAYSALFHDVRGAGTLAGLLAIVEGAMRLGLRGAVGSCAAVATTALIWPQAAIAGFRQSPVNVVVLCTLIGGSTILVTRFARRTTAMLRRAQEQFSAAFQHASIGMAVVDSTGDLVQVNHALADMIGVSEGELTGRSVHELVDVDDCVKVIEAVAEVRTGHGMRLHARLSHTGELRWGLLTFSKLTQVPGVGDQLVLHVEDVTDRRLLEETLAHQAGHDSLTGLPNRAQLVDRIANALASPYPRIAVLFIDLDRFKHVNDACGHSTGDQLLVDVARRLQEVVRPGDVVARLGGDEFVVLCHDVSGTPEIGPIAERVLTTLALPFIVEGEMFFVGASIGVSLPTAEASPDTLLRDADTAMYLAKDAGGGRHQVFVPSMRAAALRRHDLEAAMRAALDHDELELHFQPTVDLRTHEIGSMEALLRWHHPRRGDVSPAEFIPVAEETDLIIDIGTWVLRAAMERSVEWARVFPRGKAPTMCVNVSRRQLAQVGFVGLVARLLEETGADPRGICLEVTETALAGGVEPLVDALEALRRLGVRLAIDDFGTGHASLTYLSRFRVDMLKIDRSFVMGLPGDRGSDSIVGSVTAMGHAFGLQVVAEGVETDEQLARLLELGCDVAQGYLFSRPLPAEPATEFALRGVQWPAVPSQRTVAEAGGPLTAAARAQRRGTVTAEQRYRLLLDLARDVTGCLDLPTVLERTFSALRQITHFTGGSVQLVDDHGELGIAAADPPATTEAMAARIPLGQGVGGTIAMTGEPRYIADITGDRAVTSARRRRSTSVGVRSYYGVPLICAGGIIGVLQVDSVEADAWTEEDRLLVLAFAPIVAAAVDNARRFERQVIRAERAV